MLTVDDLAEFVNVTWKDGDEPDPRRRELESHLRAAVTTVENRTGPIWRRTVSYSVRAHGGLLALPAVRLAALEQVIGPAGEVSTTPNRVDLHTGLIWLPDGSGDSGPYVVTVVAGWTDPPDDLVRSVLYVAGHLWESQRGRASRPGTLGEDRTGGAPAWAIPYTAQTLMEPYLLPLDARSA
jgi:hypothetical protein